MARIKVNDLPNDMKISKDEMKRVKGGLTFLSPTSFLKIETTPDIKIDATLDSSLTDPYLGKIDVFPKIT